MLDYPLQIYIRTIRTIDVVEEVFTVLGCGWK